MSAAQPERVSSSSVVSPDSIDGALACLVPWLASRYDFTQGCFSGEEGKGGEAVGIVTAQAVAILTRLDLYATLPHVVKVKFAAWPTLPDAQLAAPAKNSALAIATRDARKRTGPDFVRALAPFRTEDGGFSLHRDSPGRGMMAAAYHLLVEARPAWHEARRRPTPLFDQAEAERLAGRFLPTFGL